MDFDLLTFVLLAASTFAAGTALVGFGASAMFDTGISEVRRGLYGAFAVAPSIGWLIYAAWAWDARGLAFTVWAAVIGFAVPGLVTLIMLGSRKRHTRKQRD